MISKTYFVYGAEGHRQRVSFGESYKRDFSKNGDVRIIEVQNSDVTGTNEYSVIKITRNTAEECWEELEGQLTDGIFENSRYGKVIEVITSKKDLVDKVKKDYFDHSTELNSLFFTFPVSMKSAEIIAAYKELVCMINGDVIIHLSNVIEDKKPDGTLMIFGEETSDDSKYLNKDYSGLCSSFLESLNGKEKETGWYRFPELKHKDALLGGVHLDFIW